MGGEPASLKQTVIEDPYKIAVSSPLSQYLSSQIGKGLPRYTGQYQEPLSQEYESTYKDFLALKPGEWYDKAVAEPTIKEFQENLLPEITEGFAGSLRGSGRYSAEEAGITELSQGLAQGRAQAEVTIPQAQAGMEFQRAEYLSQGKALEYADWYKSLPEMNPALEQSLKFLSGPSGRDVVTYMDPGESSFMGMGASLGMALGILFALPTGGLSLGMGALYGLAGGAAAGAIADQF